MSKNFKYSMLCDIYAPLLSKRQREAVKYYYDYDMSLAEISQNMGISRQGVREHIIKAEKIMDELDSGLNLHEICKKLEDLAKRTDGTISEELFKVLDCIKSGQQMFMER